MKPQQSGPSERKTHRAWVAALMLVACATVQAGDADSERESLARIENELAVVQQMVAAASRDAPPSQRVNFRYEWLINDLDVMRRGIQQHLNAPMQPRPVEPLRGDYRQ
ncbi:MULTISPECIES: RAQPRD family integrative conjugative element protein [Alcaligenes]|uniref:Conjugal transfer protein n=2 Tax=Alcaligenes TaxID=507 RepID=A0AB33CSW9_ALCFA|nr:MULTISPECIES: RAQPRD family integrative conjugative element protein [Alcaligenes]ASR89673.1 conjugal transfer protein [Alcaligenes faecalis]QCP80939.1 conjugal transfer protein [Alcaligenes faecalis]QXX79125.1 conjugal transfer protein [Alcaligenes ammonioxydans]UUO09385.1 RAQPRD family integrative conjugative element protein [Alcaligenes faecalis]WGQ34047.1 RAQPRD family integrative conjugative element protein [Alcaligenes faecalis]